MIAFDFELIKIQYGLALPFVILKHRPENSSRISIDAEVMFLSGCLFLTLCKISRISGAGLCSHHGRCIVQLEGLVTES